MRSILACIAMMSIATPGNCKKWDTIDTLWPNAVVPYKVSKSIARFDKSGVLQAAMKSIESRTCIKFVNRTTEKAFLDISSGFDCAASLGYSGDRQRLDLIAPFCLDKKRVLKLLLQALGLPLEQLRPDRDQYITINWDNIEKADHVLFTKIESSKLPFNELPYDYKSVLHADSTYKAINSSLPTITAIRPGIIVGKATDLSTLDVQKLKTLYC